MKITKEISLEEFEGWSGAEKTLDKIISEGKAEEFEFILEDLYPEGMDETQLNDLLCFEPEWCFEAVGIRTESEIKSELEEAEEELESMMNDYRDEIDDEELTEEEKAEIWECYQSNIEEIENRIAELKEELEEYDV